MNKKLMGIAGIVLVIILVLTMSVVTFTKFHKSKIDLNDYVKVTYSGYNSYGNANVELDDEKLYHDVYKKAKGIDKEKIENIKSLDDLSDTYNNEFESFAEMLDSVSCKLDKSTKLSNNDKVTIKFKYNNDSAAKYNIKFVGNKKQYKVKGLKNVKEINPFEGVKIVFEGISPNAKAHMEKVSDEDIYNYISFSLSKNKGIKKGDVITVSVDEDDDTFANKYGYVFKTKSKDFTCDSVDEYINSLSEIPPELLNSIKSQTENAINSYFTNEKNYINMNNLTYEGCYMLVTKLSGDGRWSEDDSEWNYDAYYTDDMKNCVYVIYSADVSSKEENKSFDTTKVYLPIKYVDLIKYADNTGYVDLDENNILGNTDLKYNWFSYVKGYTSTQIMYSDLVAAKKDNYTEYVSEGMPTGN